MRWLNYADRLSADHIADEMVKSLFDRPLPQSERIARAAAVQTRLDLAAHGELFDGEDIVPVSSDPDLWEIRWRFGQELFRQYHYEPPRMPGWLVALRFHRKIVVHDDDTETRRLQNLEIRLASERLRDGRASAWGSDLDLT